MGVGEPPSWEKAAMYVVMCLVLILCGGGMLSLDSLLLEDLLRVWLGV
jgi:putative oxidoreductase